MNIKAIKRRVDFEEILISAERYALGRRTYITFDVASIIDQYLPDATDNFLSVINRDFEFAERVDESMFGKKPVDELKSAWGDECDRRRWYVTWAKVKAEMKERKEKQ